MILSCEVTELRLFVLQIVKALVIAVEITTKTNNIYLAVRGQRSARKMAVIFELH